MKLPKYEIRAETDFTLFRFVSSGKNGDIQKIVEFSETNLKGFYNLAFGDEDPITRELNDTAVSNNGDAEKILATVVYALYAFTAKYPDAWVYATGSTPSRTRLYRMGINKYFEDVQKDFYIFGEFNETWYQFQLNTNYEGFLVKRKLNT